MSNASPEYCGWIPTVSGWLSFSHAGSVQESHYILNSISFNNTLQNKNGLPVITSYQRRNLSDRPLSSFPKYFHTHQVRRGYWDFFTILVLNPKNSRMEGKVWIVSSLAKTNKIQESIDAIKSKNNYSEYDIDHLRKYIDSACMEAKAAWYCASTTISRDGTCDIYGISRSDAQILAEVREKEQNINSEARKASDWLCAFETYSFLKDLFHRHKYHSLDDDTIAPLVEKTTCDWAEKTKQCLHSSVIAFSRNTKEIEQLQDARGLLSYHTTFSIIHEKSDSELKKIPTTNLDNSIKNSIEKEDTARKDLRALHAFIFAALFIPFAVVKQFIPDFFEKNSREIIISYGFIYFLSTLSGIWVYVKRSTMRNLGKTFFGRLNLLFLQFTIANPSTRIPLSIGLISISAALVYIVFVKIIRMASQ